jgi:hypothetical protein
VPFAEVDAPFSLTWVDADGDVAGGGEISGFVRALSNDSVGLVPAPDGVTVRVFEDAPLRTHLLRIVPAE